MPNQYGPFYYESDVNEAEPGDCYWCLAVLIVIFVILVLVL